MANGNEILDKIGYNSTCITDISEIFAPIGGVGLLNDSDKFHYLLPWQ